MPRSDGTDSSSIFPQSVLKIAGFCKKKDYNFYGESNKTITYLKVDIEGSGVFS